MSGTVDTSRGVTPPPRDGGRAGVAAGSFTFYTPYTLYISLFLRDG